MHFLQSKIIERARKGFTLIELLVVIAIIAILSVVVILTLNPAELLRQSRDANRISDMDTLNHAIGLYSTDQSAATGFSLGVVSTTYISIPDPLATSTAGDQCQGLGLPALPGSYVYHCSSSSTYRNTDGTGWIPINFKNISSGSPLGNLPVDAVNTTSSSFYYTYVTNGTQFEVTSIFESQKYAPTAANDGGSYDGVYQLGTKLDLTPPIRGGSGLVGYWPLAEGTSTVAYDYSGNGNNGTWSGTQAGSNGYYTSSAKPGAYAGYFNGFNDKISLTTTNILEPTSVTVSAWVQVPVQWGSGFATIGNQYGGGYNLIVDTGANVDWNVFNGGTRYRLGYNAMVAGQWYLLTGTFNGSLMQFYINGQLLNATTGVLSYTTPTFGIGVPASGPTSTYMISDVRIYNRALSANEVQALYNAGK